MASRDRNLAPQIPTILPAPLSSPQPLPPRRFLLEGRQDRSQFFKEIQPSGSGVETAGGAGRAEFRPLLRLQPGTGMGTKILETCGTD